jgi:hypothetical protein
MHLPGSAGPPRQILKTSVAEEAGPSGVPAPLSETPHGFNTEGVAEACEFIEARVELLGSATGHEDSNEDGTRGGDIDLRDGVDLLSTSVLARTPLRG